MNTYGLEGRSIDRLLSLKKLADVSKEQYLNSLRQFLVYSKQDPDALVTSARTHHKAFEKRLIDFLGKKEAETSPSTAALIRNSVKKFLDVNGVAGIDWPYIDDHITEKKRFGQDRAPTMDEIRRMVNAADLRVKCIVLFLCSSGARIGAINQLKWRDVAEVESDGVKLARVTIYRGEREQYDAFITPEACENLLEYRRYRENVGEKVTLQSPVFVTASNVDDFRPERIRALATDTVKNLLARLQKQLGLREVLSEGKNARRFEFKQGHGFRKFFKTRMELSGAKPIMTEMLMGHAVGVSNSYMKPTQEEMIGEYVKAIDNLTIIGKREERTDRKTEFKREILLKVGGYSKEEVDKLDLAGMQDEEIQKMVRERLLGVMANNGNHQRVIPINEVETYLTKGWEYVAALPTGKAVLKLPN
ncbi:MAG TPA: site-specific integrase [Nitrososphaerales archaeon]|nr:site-specific integrase [Nitrososphaerales archaeon]